MGGVYFAYDTPDHDFFASTPKGYQLCYLSHYGRHGSRWLPSDNRYEWVLRQLADKDNLTGKGKKLSKQMEIICNHARGNGGRLTALGAMQHQQLARRMVQHFPQLFREGNKVKARSSVVGRCRKSMLSFCLELRKACPGLTIDERTDSADMDWISHESPDEMLLKMDAAPGVEGLSRPIDASALQRPHKSESTGKAHDRALHDCLGYTGLPSDFRRQSRCPSKPLSLFHT